MATEFEPKVGEWYKYSETGKLFEVVAFDEDEGAIEIQHLDGEVEELDLEIWFEVDLEMAEAPEDWSAAYDGIDKDDLGYSDKAIRPEDWSGPMNEIDRLESD
ncbi:hypothetical protein BOW53_06365 [Solemya pervernicosa gill symbiont]|uniref:Uncharacterized protein n=2 Tax=Gammaproteobacteria incertae sedis TaxID=118884 RepID=A0A1T2L6Y1_9GAMM|nr:DUF6763 family protein [Candidatus Reidiella endopervernicosa]OOZ40833.1 hypothetical protein BOW53_06365 [Solemya pervernicosa gill symbiont]QKQ26345.1 hypothetical protein HUE57_08670 [Candidatus Reidiella endopervernicosa]